jgi:hypothetical protein
MKSIAIDPQTSNFIRHNGRMRYTKGDLEFFAQVVRHELSLFLGEWYLNTAKGLPYRSPKARKSEHRSILETALRAKLINIKGLKKVLSFTPKYDKKERLYEVSFTAETEAGLLESAWESSNGGNT